MFFKNNAPKHLKNNSKISTITGWVSLSTQLKHNESWRKKEKGKTAANHNTLTLAETNSNTTKQPKKKTKNTI